jgi:glutaredoxin 3
MNANTSLALPAIVMYSKSWCPYCERARALLKHKGVTFQEIDIETQPGQREDMIRRSGGQYTVPQIFIGERHVGGSDELYELDAAGGLDPLLQQR